MAAAEELDLNQKKTEKFVKLCAFKFGWKDLSEDTVMDVGCGRDLFCTRAVLENFPNVQSIIALDCIPSELRGIAITTPKITLLLANIRKREDIHQYQGKVDKVLSTHVVHQNSNKKKIFKNVYHVLKPGGEAAFLFAADVSLYHVLNDLKEDSRFKAYFKGSDVIELYSSELKADDYREMLEKIGFKVIEISEEKDVSPCDAFKQHEEDMYELVAQAFGVPSDLVSEINDAALHLYLTKYQQEKSVYVATEMSIFVKKPSNPAAKCSNS